MAWYLRLGSNPTGTTYMLAEEEDPLQVGQRIADALVEGTAALIRWVPADRLDAVMLWVNPAQQPFWDLTETRPDEH